MVTPSKAFSPKLSKEEEKIISFSLLANVGSRIPRWPTC
jgi:hypothetical protein